jgi:hypothetical protein
VRTIRIVERHVVESEREMKPRETLGLKLAEFHRWLTSCPPIYAFPLRACALRGEPRPPWALHQPQRWAGERNRTMTAADNLAVDRLISTMRVDATRSLHQLHSPRDAVGSVGNLVRLTLQVLQEKAARLTGFIRIPSSIWVPGVA